jgi:hypothetical protein
MTEHTIPLPPLPPSLAASPTIPYEKQTLAELIAERDYWQTFLDRKPDWRRRCGLIECRDACNEWIARRTCPK